MIILKMCLQNILYLEDHVTRLEEKCNKSEINKDQTSLLLDLRVVNKFNASKKEDLKKKFCRSEEKSSLQGNVLLDKLEKLNKHYNENDINKIREEVNNVDNIILSENRSFLFRKNQPSILNMFIC